MINIDDDPKEIIKELSETEKNILYILGKMRISVKKNFDENTLKKKLNNNDLKNYKKAFSNLCACGIIEMYRSGNFPVSKQKFIVQLLDNPCKRIEIARNLNITSETLSKPLVILQKLGLIKINNEKKYQILDSIGFIVKK